MRILIVLLALAALALFLMRRTANMPDVMTVTRRIRIGAPRETVFGLLQDFRRWPLWSPWEQLDPDLKRTYGGAPFGEGATYDWSGNRKAGSGRMRIVEAAFPNRLAIELSFIRPFETQNRVEFNLLPEGGQTEVIWSMRGPNPPMAKLMSLVMDMDKMIGKDFEKGLAQLKAAAEGANRLSS